MFNIDPAEARRVRSALKNIVTAILHEDPDFSACWRVYRATVTSAPNGSVCGVLIVGQTESVSLPYSITMKDAEIGDLVLVGVAGNSLSNGIVFQYANWGLIATRSETLVGNPITTVKAVAGNATECSIEFPIVQGGSGTPSVSNIRPITCGNSLSLVLNGTTIPITLQTANNLFAAGELNVLTGALEVTHECLVCDGTETIGTAGSPTYNVLKIGALNYGVASSTATPNYCSHLAYSGSTSSQNIQAFRFLSSTTYNDYRVIFRINNITPGNVSNVTAYLSAQHSAGTPVQFCYKLTTPQTYTLTPQEILLATGANTLSANMGIITLTYTRT